MSDPTDEEIEEFEKRLGLESWKTWYRYGWRSPDILYRRLRNKYQPIFRMRMMWQRARRGWSEQDTWGLHHHLEDVIIGAVGHWRSMPPHGHPATGTFDPTTGEYGGETITYEDWLRILDEIIAGMKAAKAYEENWKWEEGGEEAFNKAMDHLRNYWFALWD